MEIEIQKTELANIEFMRVLFLHERHFQFVHNKCHLYGWADTYQFLINGAVAGYGSVWGKERDCIFEFYLLPPYRKYSGIIFKKSCCLPGITKLETQTNDLFQSTLVYQYGKNFQPEAILFEEDYTTHFEIAGAAFRKATATDKARMESDDSDYIIEYDGSIAATGGLMLNYNMPYADIYMAVKEPYRRIGLGTYMVQELKKVAYTMGRVPACRCNIKNEISKATLLKAGFKVCGLWINAETNVQNPI